MTTNSLSHRQCRGGVSQADLLAVADRIGARLCRDAMFYKDRCTWIGPSLEWVDGLEAVVQRACGRDLYGGTSGIGLFLAHLSHLTGDLHQKRTACAALRHARLFLERDAPKGGIGLYSGVTGIAYALVEADRVFPGEGLAARAIDRLRALTPPIEQSIDLDVISGCAGAIQGLLAIAARFPTESFLAVATKLGDHLIERAHSRPDGTLSWHSDGLPTSEDLTGFSHGAAGISLSLLELWAVTHESRFRAAADAGFAYERRVFSKEHNNWPDFRIPRDSSASSNRLPNYMIAWCHGAPGIGLSRLRAFQLTMDESYQHEAHVAVETTRSQLDNGASDCSLCHGLTGKLELLIVASDVLGDQDSRKLAKSFAVAAASKYSKEDCWPCGIPSAGEAPGLMLGIAGIAYQFLRLTDRSLPSVLCIV
jgi:lantibiotic biosynthesis protein